MKHKRFFYVMTAVIYAIVLLFSTLYAFTVKSVKCSYTMVQGDTGYERADKIISKAKGKNIFFVNTSKMKSSLEKDPYIQVKSIKKNYPDTLEVVIEERKEMFYVSNGEDAYVLDERYFVLAKKPLSQVDNLIGLELNFLENKSSLKEGKYLEVIDNDIIKCVDKMLNVFSDWKNLLKNIRVEEKDFLNQDHKNFRVDFQTAQGCLIEVRDVLRYGEDKALKAYETYLSLSDLQKSEGEIDAYELEIYSYPECIVATYKK